MNKKETIERIYAGFLNVKKHMHPIKDMATFYLGMNTNKMLLYHLEDNPGVENVGMFHGLKPVIQKALDNNPTLDSLFTFESVNSNNHIFVRNGELYVSKERLSDSQICGRYDGPVYTQEEATKILVRYEPSLK